MGEADLSYVVTRVLVDRIVVIDSGSERQGGTRAVLGRVELGGEVLLQEAGDDGRMRDGIASHELGDTITESVCKPARILKPRDHLFYLGVTEGLFAEDGRLPDDLLQGSTSGEKNLVPSLSEAQLLDHGERKRKEHLTLWGSRGKDSAFDCGKELLGAPCLPLGFILRTFLTRLVNFLLFVFCGQRGRLGQQVLEGVQLFFDNGDLVVGDDSMDRLA